ncbi:MAG TPA: sigma-70 family RNA polymerase sigma factor [Anaerolineae bacterium]|nr:sigma-70 family RNA polymerase sigma factor [Anaerolineae bacterium]HOR00284.1 sigma-70 family RNA polymerase sigma factor [Anaerolineae bacterium]
MSWPLRRVVGRSPREQGGVEAGSDEALAAAAPADPAAFVLLYQRYLNPVYRFCYARLGERQAAEDATAEVFLKAFANLRRFQGGVFAAWLYTVARNVVIDHVRQRHPTEPLEDAGRALAQRAVDTTDEQRAVLLAALAELPDEQRTVLELQFAGWSGGEIAAALGKSPAAIRMARHRAVERLQELLNPGRKG